MIAQVVYSFQSTFASNKLSSMSFEMMYPSPLSFLSFLVTSYNVVVNAPAEVLGLSEHY
jgi:hypothetical protein